MSDSMDFKQVRVPKDQCIDLSGKAIEVIVGTEPPTTLIVHENLVCASSAFFKKAMNQAWAEGNNRSISFEEDEPNTFMLYFHWLCYNTLPTKSDQNSPASSAEYFELAKAYVLGDKIEDGDFQDVVVDAIIDKCNSKASDGIQYYPGEDAVQHIYENTPETSQGRLLLADLYISKGGGKWLQNWPKSCEIPKDFLFDVAVGSLNQRDYDPGVNTKNCDYHQHGSEEIQCYRERLMAEMP